MIFIVRLNGYLIYTISMLTIRLKRTGRRNKPFYRIVVMEAKRSTQGAYLETVGHFNPKEKLDSLVLKEDRIAYWTSKGAQISPTVHNFLIDKNVIKGAKKKASSMSNKRKKQCEESAKEEVKAEKKHEAAAQAVAPSASTQKTEPTPEETPTSAPAPAEEPIQEPATEPTPL